MSQNKKSPEVGVFHRDRRDQSRDKVSVRFRSDRLDLLLKPGRYLITRESELIVNKYHLGQITFGK